MSGDPEQEYFADGVVEDIITALSHFPRLFVIARNSSFTYKGRAVDIRRVGQELGVRYVVEGSIRRSGNRVRLTGQLIDASEGTHLWADRFDGLIEDVFEIQDHVTASVVGAIAPRVLEVEVERARRRRPDNLDAYDLYLRTLAALSPMSREGNDHALSLVKQALGIDPGYAVVAGLGAWAYCLRAAHGWRADPDGERRHCISLAGLALAQARGDAEALSLGGYATAWRAPMRSPHNLECLALPTMPTFKALNLILVEPKLLLRLRQRRRGIRRARGRAFG